MTPTSQQHLLSQHLRALKGPHRDQQHPLDNWAQFKATNIPLCGCYLGSILCLSLLDVWQHHVWGSGFACGGQDSGQAGPVLGASLSWPAVGNKSKKLRNISFPFLLLMR